MPIKHGLTKSRFYRIWRRMNDRVNDKLHPHYKDYKDKKISSEWLNFMNFRDDMYKSYEIHSNEYTEIDTSLDRIDNSLGYSKKNCRWATSWEQQQNRKDNVWVVFKGQRKTRSQWAKDLKMSFSTLRSRLYNGWTVKRALTQIINHKNKQYIL